MNEFKVGRDAIGFIFSAQYVTTVLGTILFGEIANHFGRKIALFYSVLWDALLTALTALAPNNFYTGFSQISSGMGVSWGIVSAMSNEVYSPKLRGYVWRFNACRGSKLKNSTIPHSY